MNSTSDSPFKNSNRGNYSPTYNDEHALINHFTAVLEERLSGRDMSRRINTHPMDWCLLAALGPQKETHEPVEPIPEQPDIDPDSPAADTAHDLVTNRHSAEKFAKNEAKAVNGTTSSSSERPDDARGIRRPPSALGFEVLLEPDHDGYVTLSVDVSFCVFTKHLPTLLDQQSLPTGAPLAEIGMRWPVTVSGIQIRIRPGQCPVTDNGTVQNALNAILEAAFARDDVDRQWPTRPKLLDTALESVDAFDAFLAGGKTFPKQEWRIHAGVEIRSTVRSDGLVRLGCYLRNTTVETPAGTKNKGQLDAYLTIGDGRIAATVCSGEIRPIEILPVPHDYQYDRRVWGVGHNTSVRVDLDKRSITTHALARFEQLRVVTKDNPPANFLDLATDPIRVLTAILAEMKEYLEDWRTRILAQNALNLDPQSLEVCTQDCDGFEDEVRRFSSGIAALLADDRLMNAFKASNRVFSRVANGYTAWRLFQIVFFVTQLPALAIREGISSGTAPDGTTHDWGDCLEWGDVLWFRTGGGKTEAYLGLSCCAMLYDRLRGKTFGLTSWLRLPLRMLSIQQVQRAMRVVWEAEQERQELLGDHAQESDPFRLGYFAGSNGTPNDLSDETLQRFDNPEALERIRIVPDCPACKSRGTIQVTVDSTHKRFRHCCTSCKVELPLDVSDGEVYRYLPSLLVGTIDKMATVGQQSKFGILWGGASWKCPLHGYATGEYCGFFGCKHRKKKGGLAVTPKDPSPALHIQDELHLLQEDLGAFAGHYETLIRFCERTLSTRPSKIIAATATIEGFEHQVRHLYGTKGARRFPGRGYDRNSNFYAGPDVDPELKPKSARVFLAFKTSSLPPADASAKVTEIIQTEATHLVKNPHLALAFLKDASSIEDVEILLKYYTTSLNYVGSLARGSRVRQFLEDTSSRVRSDTDRELNVEYTSSRSSNAEVTAIVHQIENPPAWSDPSFLDALVATNMISHGVDLERVNIMTMDGIPEETAEYIQASSRSGRRHLGMVIVVLADYSLRAASIYHRFLEYHEHLDRMVSPVPVNRFAKFAVDRTLPGVTMGLLYGLHVPLEQDTRLNKRHAAAALVDKLGADFDREIKRAYALGNGVYDTRLEQGMQQSLDTGIDKMRMHLHGSHEDKARDALRPSPMQSLRDVEVGVPFWPDADHALLLFVERTRE